MILIRTKLDFKGFLIVKKIKNSIKQRFFRTRSNSFLSEILFWNRELISVTSKHDISRKDLKNERRKKKQICRETSGKWN